jgi:NAD(P)H-hydrate epimerase
LTTEAILIKILSGSEKSKLIFDAGALHIMSSMAPLKNKIDQSILLTPHPGEASVLLNRPIEEIQKNRSLAARNISEMYGASIVILKGMETLIYSAKEDDSYISMGGGPELSSGGTGDILAHAEAGKIFSEEIGEIGLNASSLIPIIRKLLNQ